MIRDLAAGPRILLRRLRELTAEPLEPQDRLDRIVTQIARNMVAEVCSVYVLRADGVLELLAVRFSETDAPAGNVDLDFAGGGTVRLSVECLEARLQDLGAAWAAKATPEHSA